MMDDEVGSLVEKLKPQFVTKWLKTVCDVRFDVMVMCLLPKPMEFARVSGSLLLNLIRERGVWGPLLLQPLQQLVSSDEKHLPNSVRGESSVSKTLWVMDGLLLKLVTEGPE